MQKIYLISTDVLKSNSIINSNVDDSLLLNAIFEAQQIELQQILGSALYNRILDDIDNSTLSGDYKTLVDDYCQNVVTYYATARAIPYVHYKIVNKGVNNQSSDNSQPTAFNEMNFLLKKVQDDAEFFAQRLTSYLEANKDSFPDYKACCSCCGDIQPSKNNYRCGLVLDEREYKRNYNILDITL